MNKSVKISLAMIVRDEENTLTHCLQSVVDAVDEIIIVDTGSKDATREIAAQYTDRIYDLVWQKNFAQARNYAFDLATGDWVIWLDADDILFNADKIRSSILSATTEINSYYWKYIYNHDEVGNSICELWRERCVRNNKTFKWVGKVHEVLIPSGSPAHVYNEEIIVLHQHKSLKLRNPYRNIEILKEEYENTKSDPDLRMLLYLGLEYFSLRDYESAITFLKSYVDRSDWEEQKYLAQLKIADICRKQMKYEEALAADFYCLRINPQWPNAYYSLAEIYYFLKDWPKTIYWIELGRTLPSPFTICVVNPMDLQYRWIIHYTNALFHTQRISEALEWTEKALKINPTDAWHLANRNFFSSQN